MDVVVSGLVWLPKKTKTTEGLDIGSVTAIQKALTIVPKATSDIGEERQNLLLYRETDTHIGVPRQWYKKNVTLKHNEKMDVSMGHPLSAECVKLGYVGSDAPPYNEQIPAVERILEELKPPWGGCLLQAACGFGKCVTPDTLIATNEGVLQAGDLIPELDDQSLPVEGYTVAAMDGEKSISHFYGKKVAPVLKLQTKHGHEVTGTHHHPVLVLRDSEIKWLPLSEIQAGDYVAVKKGFSLGGSPVELPTQDPYPKKMDTDLAYTMGLLTGDGCLTQPHSVLFTNSDQSIVDDWIQYTSKFGHPVKSYGYDHHVYRSEYKKFFLSVGMTSDKSVSKVIPKTILLSGQEVIRAFLQGYFDTDGEVNLSSQLVCVTSGSHTLLKQVQFLLLGFGVYSVLSKKAGKYKGERVWHWRLSIYRDELATFANRVGFRLGRRQEALLSLVEGYHQSGPGILAYPLQKALTDLKPRMNPKLRRKYSNYFEANKISKEKLKELVKDFGLCGEFWDTLIREDIGFTQVISVEDSGQSRVVDLTVPDGANFVANGLIVHNTSTAIRLIPKLGKTTLVIVNKEFFMKQWTEEIQFFLPGAKIGYIQGPICDVKGKDVVIAMVHSLAQKEYAEWVYSYFGLVITDECFVGSTSLLTEEGKKSISSIRAGDRVLHATGTGEVTAVSSHLVSVEDMRIIRFNDGQEVVCTKDHPFLTEYGWVSASELTKDVFDTSVCLTLQNVQDIKNHALQRVWTGVGDRNKVLLSAVRGQGTKKACDGTGNMFGVQTEGASREAEEILLSILSAEMDDEARESFFDQRKNQSLLEGEIGFRPDYSSEAFGENEKTEPLMVSRGLPENLSDAEKKWSHILHSGREWSALTQASPDIEGCTIAGMDSRVSNKNRIQTEKPHALSTALQGRLSQSDFDASDRDRRRFTPAPSQEGAGSEETKSSDRKRVESVAFLEQRDFDRFGISIEQNKVRVYNLSVSGHPSYVLENGVIVHNCHNSGSETFSTVVPKFTAAYRCGLSATPNRKDGCERAYLDNIGNIVYKAKTESLIPTVYLVSGNEIPGLKKYGKFRSFEVLNSAEAESAVTENIEHSMNVVSYVVRAAKSGRKVMVLSKRIEQLAKIYELLRNQQDKYTIGWVTGKQPVLKENGDLVYAGDKLNMRSTKEEDLEAANRCQILLATKQLISEGYNNPAIDTMVFAMPQSDIEQTVGRIRRHCTPNAKKCANLCPWRAGKCQQKPEPVVVDILNNNRRMFGKFNYRRDYYSGIGAKYILDEKMKREFPKLAPKKPPVKKA